MMQAYALANSFRPVHALIQILKLQLQGYPMPHTTKPLLEHVDFLLALARKLSKDANFVTPFPKVSLKQLQDEVLAYNRQHPKHPVSTKDLSRQYQQLRDICQRDGGPLYLKNSEEVTIKDLLENSLKKLDEQAQDPKHYLV